MTSDMSINGNSGYQIADKSVTPPKTGFRFTRTEIEVITCSLGIYACYIYYGYLHERIYHVSYGPEQVHFNYSLFLVACQCAVNALFALCSMVFFSHTTDKTPQNKYAMVALFYLLAMLFSFNALQHMSYPMQALGKSCKMIPVMLMGIIIRKRKYKLRDYLCVAMITTGVLLFSMNKRSDGKQHTSSWGMLLLLASLFMDGLTGPFQEKLVAEYSPSTHQLMFFQNAWAVLWLLIGLVATGEGVEAVQFVRSYPIALADISKFCVVSALGQNFIFYAVRNISALTCTAITTTRKFFTILFSVLYYKHGLSGKQWLAVLLVFGGIIWETVSKHTAKKANKTIVDAGTNEKKSQ